MGCFLHIDSLRSLPLFGNLYEAAIAGIHSSLIECIPDRKSSDCIGAHWYGMRVRVNCLKTGIQLYLHTGMIFHPDTRRGLMIEVDKKNNFAVYDLLREKLESGKNREVEKGEAVYLKLFMPDADYAALCRKKASDQIAQLSCFFQDSVEEIARILEENMPGFNYPETEFGNSLALLQMIRTAIDNADQSRFDVQREANDPDNIGSYAFGSRYWLTVPEKNVRLYAYFGVIFSHQKDPAGLFAEIDQPSNPEFYETSYNAVPDSPDYVISHAEPRFLKLFLPETKVQDFNRLTEEGQLALMLDFLNSTNLAFTAAWI